MAAVLFGAVILTANTLPDRRPQERGRGGPPAVAPHRIGQPDPARLEAARLMQRALASIASLRAEKGRPVDRALDPNATGLIGDEFSPLTTSVGEVGAKRTSANPAFAAVLVKYFEQAGLKPGDVVAVGASGSFPGFLLATLCAARALGVEPVVIYSVGASMHGANLPGLTFPDMLARLRADGLLPYRLAAVSAGGDGDSGAGVLFDDAGEVLQAETRRVAIPIVPGRSLAESIVSRLQIYEHAAGGRPIRAYVNVGGASASFGDMPESLKLPNGLVRRAPEMPTGPTRGMVFEFLARGIPVIHLLHVAGLAAANDLPFDPVPFPPIGEGRIYRR